MEQRAGMPHRKSSPRISSYGQKLHPYFLSHPVGVKTNLLLNQTLGKPDTFGRLVKWVVELSEYDISYLTRTTIKAHTLADFVSEMVGIYLGDTPKLINGYFTWMGRLQFKAAVQV
ncbi:UNVERIFIED_CONTAM: hypothetical protein Sradi_7051300 [Sesamum radiatum]|uniref:Uncharacterized protein n=1 Tax=Sesamum radiatum TaxID=300843 RepID=A0AAW2J9Y5_SESRA